MAANISTPDFRRYPMSPGVASAEIEPGWLHLRWADGVEGRFHCVWLRESLLADFNRVEPLCSAAAVLRRRALESVDGP